MEEGGNYGGNLRATGNKTGAMRGSGGGLVVASTCCWLVVIFAKVAAMPEVIKFGKIIISALSC